MKSWAMRFEGCLHHWVLDLEDKEEECWRGDFGDGMVEMGGWIS